MDLESTDGSSEMNSHPATNSSNNLSEMLKNISQQSMTKTSQQIWLQGNDNSNSFAVYGREVDVIASGPNDGNLSAVSQTAASSNKIKVNPVVKYEWEHKYYFGNLVAVHRNGIYIAYVIKGRSDGNVRVINRKTAERALLKGFEGNVTDISFAHISPVILGAVDEVGNMFIYEILDAANGTIETSLLLQINRSGSQESSDSHRLIWCPYIPEEEDSSGTTHNTTDSSSVSEDVGKLLVLTHDNIAEMWSIDTVIREYGNGVMSPDEVETGYLTISSHTKPIVDAAFSPDGTALATASLDGDVKFFQVYLQDRSPPRCLHQWQPHGGKPVSSLFFLDDHKHPNPEVQFWKFAVTGADNNSEIKIWSCESWTCLQTIKFTQAVSPDLPTNFQSLTSKPCIKASMDLSANYIVLSDIRRKVLYVLHIHQESETSAAHISSISEFLLAQPCLSFSVLDASKRRFKKLPDHDVGHMGDVTTGEIVLENDEEVPKKADGPDIGVVVKMYSVHIKALQELVITFKPETSVAFSSTPSQSTISTQDNLKDTLSDLSMDPVVYETDVAQSADDLPAGADHLTHTSNGLVHVSESSSETSPHAKTNEVKDPTPLLLTPDAFTSPRKVEPPVADSVRSSNSSSFTQVTAMDEDALRTPHTSIIQPHISPASSLYATQTSNTVVIKPEITEGDEASSASASSSHKSAFPAAPNLQELQSLQPLQSDEPTSAKSTLKTEGSESLDELYSSGNRRPLASTGSSSSTSLEVSEILEGVRPSTQDEEEEEDGEYEDAKIEVEEDEEEGAVGQVELHTHNDRSAQQSNQNKDGDSNPAYNVKMWPAPPDVGEVNIEAQRLATDAISRAAVYHLKAREESDELGPRQEEGDVEIEEDNQEDDQQSVPEELPPPKATSSEVEETLSSMGSPSRKSRSPTFKEHVKKMESVASVDRASLSHLQASVQQMLNILQFQQREIETLRGELRNNHENSEVMTNLQLQIDNLEGALASRVAASLSQHTQSENERLQGLLTEKESLDNQKQEHLLNTVSQTLDKTISYRLDKTVREEIRQRLIPALSRSLDPLKSQMHTEMAQKLTATDALMKENLSKLVRSRQTIDAIGQAAGNAIQAPIHNTVRDLIMPGFEKSCQGVFQQMNESMQRGMHEYLRHLEHHMEQTRKKHEESRDPIVRELHSMVESVRKRDEMSEPLRREMSSLNQNLQKTLAQMKASQQEMQQNFNQSIVNLEGRLKSQMKDIVKEELSVALQDQQTTISDNVLQCLRSGAVTPAPTSANTQDPAAQHARIMGLLQQGQLNEAFQVALSASDLNLVMTVCEAVNPSQVFNQEPCPLIQPVLLSLIQQLSANLIHNTELKHKYLEEAVMNLDTNNAVTREHMTTVLGALCQKLMTFIQNYPHEKMTRNIKMLLMATQSLLK